MKTRAYVSEFIGAFALLFVGVGVIAANHMAGRIGVGAIGIALAHGLVIAAVASAVGPISGGHFNPAVTIAALVGKRIGIVDAIIYFICQAGGAIAAVWLLRFAMDPETLGLAGYGLPTLDPDNMTTSRGMVLEGFFTFFLAFVVYGTAFFRRAPKVGALYVGFAVAMSGLAIGTLTGGSVNPVRWLGSAIFADGFNDTANLLVYVVAPIIGGALAGLIFAYILEPEPELMEGTGGPAEDV